MPPIIGLVDTNLLIRAVIGEPRDQARATNGLFRRAASDEVRLVVDPIVIAEAVWVLVARYGVGRLPIAQALSRLMSTDQLITEQPAALSQALELFAATTLDFVDCWLAARAEVEPSFSGVWSFDRDFDRLGLRLSPE